MARTVSAIATRVVTTQPHRGVPVGLIGKQFVVPRLAWFRRAWTFDSQKEAEWAIDALLDARPSWFKVGDRVHIRVARWGFSGQDNASLADRLGTVKGSRSQFDYSVTSLHPTQFNVVAVDGGPKALFPDAALRHLAGASVWPGDRWDSRFPHWAAGGSIHLRCDDAEVAIFDSPETNASDPRSKRYCAAPPDDRYFLLYQQRRGLSRHRRWLTAEAAMRAIDQEFPVTCRCHVFRSDTIDPKELPTLRHFDR